MNLKLRFQNKTTLLALMAGVLPLVYHVLSMTGVVPAVSQSTLMEAGTLLINLLCLLGIVVDPTTQGVGDSQRAMKYEAPVPRKEEEEY